MQRVDAAVAERSDRELFEAARAGDYDAFEQIVRRYYGRVYRLAYGMTHSDSEAEEVVQDTFLNVFRSLHAYRADASPGSWLYRIAANSALMRLRTHRRKPMLFLDDAPPGFNGERRALWPVGSWSREPEEKLLSRELAERIEQAIDRLPEKYRLVLLLRDVEGLRNEEVAETLGLTLPTVKARLHRSRLFVRDELDRYFKGEK